MDEKKLKNTAKRIKELIPLAKAAVYETSVEERRALRDHTDEKIVKLFYLTRALRSEVRRTNSWKAGKRRKNIVTRWSRRGVQEISVNNRLRCLFPHHGI